MNDQVTAADGEAAEQPKHTPGPWRWEVSTKHKEVHLQGAGPPGWVVMDFVRWGMDLAAPRFREGSMRRVEHFAVLRKPHHVGWDQWINHPYALLIAAAPDLLAALEAQEAYDNHFMACDACQDMSICSDGADLSATAQQKRVVALARAKGANERRHSHAAPAPGS